MKREAINHPKTWKLASLLGCELPTALGYLTLLWDFTEQHAVQGDIGKWTDSAIEQACLWKGAPGVLVSALVEAKLVDSCCANRLLVHHWPDHCQSWVKAKLLKQGLNFALLERSKKGSRKASTVQSSPRQSSPVQSTPIAAAADGSVLAYSGPVPDTLDTVAFRTTWTEWLAYRFQIKHPMNSTTRHKQFKQLEAWGEPAAIEALEASMRNGWQGLFDPRKRVSGRQPTDPASAKPNLDRLDGPHP